MVRDFFCDNKNRIFFFSFGAKDFFNLRLPRKTNFFGDAGLNINLYSEYLYCYTAAPFFGPGCPAGVNPYPGFCAESAGNTRACVCRTGMTGTATGLLPEATFAGCSGMFCFWGMEAESGKIRCKKKK
jgi:hypothetical protein